MGIAGSSLLASGLWIGALLATGPAAAATAQEASTAVSGQDQNEESENAVLAWLVENDFKIRKMFDGSRSEQKPANFTFIASEGERSVYDVNVAIKASELELLPDWQQGILVVYPVVEWHRNTKESKQLETNKFSLKANFELYWTRVIGRDEENIPILSNWAPHFFVFNELAWDFEAGIEEDGSKITKRNNAHSLQFTIDGGDTRWGPHSVGLDEKEGFRFLYFPTAGVEFFNNSPHVVDGMNTTVDLSTFLVRIYFELYPLSLQDPQRFQIVSTYTHRFRLGGTADFGDDFGHWSFGVNWYFDAKRRAGFGIDYENGRTDTNKFVDRNQVSIGFKFKI